MIRRVVLYARVSSDRQAKKGESITDQLSALHEWADKNDCVIIGEYIDAGASAFKPYQARPEFCRMLSDFEHLQPDLLIFTRLDRFARNARDYHNVIYTLKEHGIKWEAISERWDQTTSSGRFSTGVFALLYEQESHEKSERAKFTNVEKRKRGELCSGKLPRGYVIQDKHPVKDPSIQDGVQAFWDAYLSGRGVQEAIKAASEHGFDIPGYSSAHAIIRKADRYSGTLQGVPAPAYITPEQAAYVEKIRKRKIRTTNYPFIFNSLIVCGECGKKYSSSCKSKTSRTGTHTWGYYVCYNRGSHPDRCKNSVCVSENLLEQYLLDNINDLMEYENHRILSEFNNDSSKDYTKMIEKLKKKRERAVNAYIDGMISRDNFNARCIAIDKELDELYALANVPEDIPEPLEPLPDNWKEIYNSLSPSAKHDFWFSSLESIIVMPDRSINVVFRH